MPVPDFTPYAGLLPSASDPATFSPRASELFTWFVETGAPQLAALAAFLDGIMEDEATVLDALDSLQATIANRLVPTGSTDMFYGNTAPAGWLGLDRSAHSRTTYADLWDYAQASGAFDPTGASETMFGPGDGSTTFDLPDARGLFPRAWDNGAGVDPGRGIGTYQADQMQRLTGAAGVSASVSATSGVFGNSTPNSGMPSGWQSGGRTLLFDSANSPDARTGDENRPKSFAVIFAIKT